MLKTLKYPCTELVPDTHASTFFCLFSYDIRGAHSNSPSHWRDGEVLEDRAVFKSVGGPAELIINPVLVINYKRELWCGIHFAFTTSWQ